VLLQWRVFDAGITAGAVEANRAAAERTLQSEAAERNAIRQRLESAYYDYRAALGQIIAANASFRASREAYRDSRARYEFGLADYTDLADTIASLTTAMEQRAEAMTLANLSYAQLLRELLPVPRQPGGPVSLPIQLPVN
jgi:outer membrane protein TolC